MRSNYFLLITLFLLALISFSVSAQGTILRLNSYSSTPSIIYPGDIVTVSAVIKNESAQTTIYDTTIFLGLNSYLEEVNISKVIDSMSPNELETVVLQFRVKETAFAGAYSIPLAISYIQDNETKTRNETITFTVSKFYGLDISNPNLSQEVFYPGEKIIVSSVVSNVGSNDARSVQVKLDPVKANFIQFLPLAETTVNLGNILAGKSKNVMFNLLVADDIEPGVYDFNIVATQLDSSTTAGEVISIQVKAKPKIIVSGIDYSSDNVVDKKKIFLSDAFALSVQLDNIGKEKAKAVKVTLKDTELIQGMREQFVGNIDVDDSSSAVFDLVANKTSTEGEHSFTAVISFIDENGLEQSFEQDFVLYFFALPPASPLEILIPVIIILVIIYFIIRMVLRQKSLKRYKG
ncbi:MAG: hypothetical protein ABH821_03290 [archaeon]